jgi:hypothetical protein
MNLRRGVWGLMCAAMLCTGNSATAVVVHDGMPADNGVLMAMPSYAGGSQRTRIGTSFTLKSASTELDKVTVAIYYQTGQNGKLELALYADAGGWPGAKLQQINYGHSYTSQSNKQNTTFTVNNGYDMTPGEKYWIVAEAYPVTSNTGYVWARSTPYPSSGLSDTYFYGSWWGWGSPFNGGAMKIETVDNPTQEYFDSTQTSGSAGGVGFDFGSVDDAGVVTVEQTTPGALPPGTWDAVDFIVNTNPATVWSIDFDGTFSGSVDLTFTYDESGLLMAEEHLRMYHHTAGGYWEQLPIIDRDLDANTITVRTDSFSPFALGAVPEPGTVTLGLLTLAGVVCRRPRRR